MTTRKVTLERAFQSLGGKENFESKYQQYNANIRYVDEVRRALPKEYRNKWIAVHNSKVVAHENTYDDIVKSLKQKDVPIEETAVKRLSTRRAMTLF